MKISQSYLNIEEEYPLSTMEITDRHTGKSHSHSIGFRRRINKLAPPESQSHRSYGKIANTSFIIPRSCQLNKNKQLKTAFNILQYQLKDREAIKTHTNNLKRNLERRIKSAKAQGNQELVAILAQESREITSLSC